ncbi:DUF1707 SHOCT-like domain-containing protein [Glycomyces albidus]|jgi:hypothetical protein|uniref:DUF1707 domain-containing protein n=1 Tax=Glycomyces albidus TaxID=2656774 RepID=A0A6L5GFY8_9ACTN|nr:DUF1707 domain-containing protein [Glycomyces albidus]MQM28501.1 DUF1707 domain-containing protein [Glycomyces albidus]
MNRPDPNLRMSNAEREAVIARLHAATEEGRLDLHEFAERSGKAYEARTYAEVEHLLADLPEPTGALAVPPAAAAPATPPGAPAEMRLAPKASHLERKGDWVVPPKLVIDAKASSVKLDCRHAVIRSGTIDVDLNLVASSLEVVLPKNAFATDDNTDVMASSVSNHAPYKGGTGIRFTFSGKAKASSVTFRHERRFLWWRW